MDRSVGKNDPVSIYRYDGLKEFTKDSGNLQTLIISGLPNFILYILKLPANAILPAKVVPAGRI